MKATKVQTLLEEFIALNKKQDDWIKKIPSEISSVFFDNTYNTAKSQQIDKLLEFIFGQWFEDVSYFIYEPAPHHIQTQKGTYEINNVNEYIDYMVAEGFLEDDRT